MPEKDMKPPKGRFASTVKVGEKGQIVIPKEGRVMFGIEAGDTLLVMGDVNRGIAVVKPDFSKGAAAMMKMMPETGEDEEE